VAETLSVQVNPDIRPLVLRREEASGLGKVVANRLLTKPGAPAKHHIGLYYNIYFHLTAI
jgi:cytochrome P450/NADPH-cytochrome P450 reductase